MTKRKPTICLMLSSGAIKGLAHLGVLETLKAHDIPIDYFVGCSVGAIVGVIYAQEQDPLIAFEALSSICPQGYSFKQLGLPNLKKGIRGQGFFTTTRFKKNYKTLLKYKKLEELPQQIYCVATNIATGKQEAFSQGPILDAVAASMAIPGLFAPVKIGENYYVDGAAVTETPNQTAKALGADIVISSDVSFPHDFDPQKKNYNMWLQTSRIMRQERKEKERTFADITIPCRFNELSNIFWATKAEQKALYNYGKMKANQMIPQIKKVLMQFENT